MRSSPFDILWTVLIIMAAMFVIAAAANRARFWLLRRMLAQAPVLREAITDRDVEAEFENSRNTSAEAIVL